jgi:hypothetical protein
MSEADRNKALMRRFYEELWSEGNLEAIPELVARRMTISGIDVVRVAGGRISELPYAEQMLELMQRLGAVPDSAASSAGRGGR